jgi:hypothetical protein
MFSELLNKFLGPKDSSGPDMEVDRDCSLRVFLDDALCLLLVHDRAGAEVLRQERTLGEKMTDTRDVLAAAVEALAPEIERRIGKVEIFLDDAGLTILDSRQAKLNHFEGRALAEFGKYQLGGKPVCFASHKFGETSVQEAEKRVVAYISEDRLTAILFALGKLARFATFFGPWSLQALFQAEDQDSWAQLSCHREFSTLTLANGGAGALAMRHLPVGSRQLAEAYADVHGISEAEAAAALAARCRLGSARPGPGDPVAHTGSFIALDPIMKQLSGEIAATSDYFEFQRLAGRASGLLLSRCGAGIAGFGKWLGEMLELDVAEPEKTIGAGLSAPALNLLEGMRTGLLKLGNQHFDFVGGHFVPSKTASSEGGERASVPALARWKAISSQPVSVATLKPLAKPALGAVLGIVALYMGYDALTASAGVDGTVAAGIYNASLSRLDQKQAPPAQAEPILWAKDLVAVAGAMPYDMKLTHIALTPGAGNVVPALEIVGTLPEGGKDNLQLVGRFMARLNRTASLHRRFSEVSFAGIGKDTKDGTDSTFKIVAKTGAAP